MDAAAHPTKPSTPPYGSPGIRQCISQSCRARRFDGRAAVMVASAPSTRRLAPTREPVDAHAGGRVKKRPRLGVTRPTTALPLAIPALERDDWVELGVPIGHRARIIKEHKSLHPEMW